MFDMAGINDLDEVERRDDPLYYLRRPESGISMQPEDVDTDDSLFQVRRPEEEITPMAGPESGGRKTSQAAMGSSQGFIGNDENPLADRTGRIHESPIMSRGTFGMAGLDVPSAGATQPLSIAGPNDSQLGIDQQKLQDLKSKGSPISRIHNPFMRGLANVGDVLGSTFLPGYAAMPWTNLKYKSNVRGAEHAVSEDLGESKEQAQTEQERAKAKQETAKAAELEHPPEKTGNTPEEVTLHDLMTGENGNPRINPETQKPYSYLEAYRATKQAAQEVKPPQLKEGEMPLGDRVPQLNKMLEGRYQILNPGQALPAQYQIPANATQKDYERIDKALEAEERSRGTKAQQDQTNEMRRQTLAIAQQGLQLRTEEAGRKQASELEKKTAPLQQSIDDAETAHQLAAMAEAGNAEADVDLALAFFKTMRSGGQGIRFTRQEQDLIMGARSLGQDVTAHAQKVVGQGQKFTTDQRNKIVQVIDLHAAAAKKALARLQTGGEEGGAGAGGHVIKIGDKQYRYKGTGATDDLKNYDEIKSK